MTIGEWEFGTWEIIGFIGQFAFFSRFFVQWFVSEKLKRSVIPVAFWYLSLIGATILLIYAVQEKNPVFTLAYGSGFFIYFRNLMLIRREKQRARIQDPEQINPADLKP